MKYDTLLFTPEANLCDAVDSFEYTISDCTGNSSTATVLLDINCTSTQTSDGDSSNIFVLFVMMLLTSMIGFKYIRQREYK